MAWTRGYEGSQLRGLQKMLRTLSHLKTRGVNKAARAGISHGLKPLVAAMKSAINASAADAHLKMVARRAIGKRLIKNRLAGKAGFGVGKGKSLRNKIATATKKHKKRGGGGVGISATNVHWFVLGADGTSQGGSGSRFQNKTGRKTGKIDPIFKGAVPLAVAASQGAMLIAARTTIERVLAAEAAKSKKG